MLNSKQKKTREKWRSLIAEYNKSDLSQNDFCKKHGISKSGFFYYKALFKSPKAIVKNDLSLFSEIKIPQRELSKQPEIKIRLPNGFECVISGNLDGCDLKELMRVLLSC